MELKIKNKLKVSRKGEYETYRLVIPKRLIKLLEWADGDEITFFPEVNKKGLLTGHIVLENNDTQFMPCSKSGAVSRTVLQNLEKAQPIDWVLMHQIKERQFMNDVHPLISRFIHNFKFLSPKDKKKVLKQLNYKKEIKK